MKKIFTWCKELFLDRSLLWALGLIFVTPMLSYYIFLFLTPVQYTTDNAYNKATMCLYHLPGSQLCQLPAIDIVSMWVEGSFYLGCFLVLTAIFVFLKKKFGLRKLMYVLLVIALIGSYFLFSEWRKQEKMLEGTLPTIGQFHLDPPPALDNMTTAKDVPEEDLEAQSLRKRIENCEVSKVIITFGGDQRFATRVELSDGSKFTDVISTAELKELQGILKDKCPFSIRNTHYDYER